MKNYCVCLNASNWDTDLRHGAVKIQFKKLKNFLSTWLGKDLTLGIKCF